MGEWEWWIYRRKPSVKTCGTPDVTTKQYSCFSNADRKEISPASFRSFRPTGKNFSPLYTGKKSELIVWIT